MNDTIRITKNNTADTRTCDYTKVSKYQLLNASKSHKEDMYNVMLCLSNMIKHRGLIHDYTKIENIDEFYADFQTGFKSTSWYEMHQETERHHLQNPKYVQDDVNLIDILEMIGDGVAAGMARSGEYRQEHISDELLRKAFDNTVKLLLDRVEVVE